MNILLESKKSEYFRNKEKRVDLLICIANSLREKKYSTTVQNETLTFKKNIFLLKDFRLEFPKEVFKYFGSGIIYFEDEKEMIYLKGKFQYKRQLFLSLVFGLIFGIPSFLFFKLDIKILAIMTFAIIILTFLSGIIYGKNLIQKELNRTEYSIK